MKIKIFRFFILIFSVVLLSSCFFVSVNATSLVAKKNKMNLSEIEINLSEILAIPSQNEVFSLLNKFVSKPENSAMRRYFLPNQLEIVPGSITNLGCSIRPKQISTDYDTHNLIVR
jgi:hypothetical protein